MIYKVLHHELKFLQNPYYSSLSTTISRVVVLPHYEKVDLTSQICNLSKIGILTRGYLKGKN